MSELIVLGRYRPGSSFLHRMDARAKLLLSFLFLVIVFIAQEYVGLAVCLLFVLTSYCVARIPLKVALTSVAPLAFMIVVTVVLNIFFVQGGAILFSWGFIIISEQGLFSAGFIALRLFLLLLGMSLLTQVTPTLDITDAFERLSLPLSRWGVPTHELSMMMGLTLRFLPLFMQEIRTIYQAQISRGATFSLNPFRGGLTMVSSLLIPLFTSAFRHAETLSLAMDARCYHGGPGRTRLHTPHFSRLDAAGASSLIIMLILVIITNLFI